MVGYREPEASDQGSPVSAGGHPRKEDKDVVDVIALSISLLM